MKGSSKSKVRLRGLSVDTSFPSSDSGKPVRRLSSKGKSKRKKLRPRPSSPGPRVRYAYADETDVVSSPVCATSARVRHVKTLVASHPAARPTGHYTSNSRPGNTLYRVSLPKEYRRLGYMHYSRRKPGYKKALKQSLQRKNSFFAKDPPLRPGSSPLNRSHSSLTVRRTGSFKDLCQDYLGENVDDDDREGGGANVEPRSPVHVSPKGFRYVLDSPLHRAMSHDERHRLRPATAKLRRRQKDEFSKKKKRRPQSASATRITFNKRTAFNGRHDGLQSPAAWVPRGSCPHLVKGHRAVLTSRGARKIAKILKVRPSPGYMDQTPRSTRKNIKKLLPRPKSAGAIHGASFPVSTRYPPHYPVVISRGVQLAQKGFPVEDHWK